MLLLPPDANLLWYVAGTVRQMILKQMSHPLRRVYTDSDCLRWSMDVARALMYLHSGAAGSMILHRDINPDNIMLTSQDPHQSDAKLVDFGLHTSIPHSEECSPDGCLLLLLLSGNKERDRRPFLCCSGRGSMKPLPAATACILSSGMSMLCCTT